MSKLIETPLTPRRKPTRRIDGEEWKPSNVFPFFPTMLIVPDNTTKRELAKLRLHYKQGAKEKATAWANHLRKKGFRARVVTGKRCYEVFTGGRK